MKTTIQRVKKIEFTDQEQQMLCSMGIIKTYQSDLLLEDDFYAQQIIDRLIDINPEKQEHKDFIMELIKELKK